MALPTANVKTILYPTDQIKAAVSTLYAHIITFMERALKWYNQGKFKHIISAVFNPFPLTFQDLLDQIGSCSQTVDQLAVSASQAEMRDMHFLLLEINRTMIGENEIQLHSTKSAKSGK
jgi:hypothetical protein